MVTVREMSDAFNALRLVNPDAPVLLRMDDEKYVLAVKPNTFSKLDNSIVILGGDTRHKAISYDLLVEGWRLRGRP